MVTTVPAAGLIRTGVPPLVFIFKIRNAYAFDALTFNT
jgi:hypothetical protein